MLTLQKDAGVAKDALGLPQDHLLDALVAAIYSAADGLPSSTSRRTQRRLARVLALAGEVERRQRSRKFSPVC